MLALLVASALTMSLIVVPITAGPDIIGVPEGYKIGQEADSDYPIDHVVSGNSSWYDGSKNQSSNLNALTTDDSIPSSITESKWTSSKANEWIDFAYGDEDSVEMVIGINNAQSDSYARLGELITRNGGEIVNTVSMKNEIEASVADIPLVAVSDFLEAVKAADLSRYIEPNLKFQATFIPNDPYWMMQWGPEKIEADYAWNTTIGDSSVLVAVIDTGIDWNHPDLVANYVALGYDWVNNDTDPMDDYGHGTHCAGIIAAELNNSVGIAGVAQVKVMAEKGLNAWGWGSEDDLANAIIHAVDAGADILSNSWGGYGESSLIHEAVEYAYDNGVLVIASAGNSASDVKLYPAAYDEVIAVTATDESDYPAYFTNFGSWVEVAAPGVDIFSTVWDDLYDYKSGTSMAAPHVAGVAALVLSQFPNVTRDWVRQWLRYTADDLGDPGFDVYYGYGRINARRAIEAAPPEHDLVITNLNTPPYLEPNSSGTVNTIVLNFGAEDESNVTVQLLVNGSLVDSKLISFLATGTSATVACSWNSTVEGIYNVTSYVVAVPNETLIENNVVSTYIYVGFPVKVFVLDSAGTDLPYVISTWQILNTNWHVFGDTMIYVDYTTLNIDDITYSDLVAADADVLIISCAYMWEFSDSEIDAISRYTLEGHGLIATAGTLYDGVPNNNKLAQLFGLNETTIWSATQTDLLHIENVTHPVFANVPDPFIFRYVTTAVPSDSQWDLNELFGGTYMALGNFLESAIVVNRGLVYISPWLETIPPYYHFHLQLLYNAITWTRYQKPMHELVVSLDCPPGLKPGESALLNATVSNVGLSNETNVELQLLIDGSEANSTTIPQLMNGTSCTIDYLWTPTVEKTYNVTAYASPVPSEDNTLNNVRSKMVTVSSLLVALFKNWDPWGYPANEEALSLYNINYIVFDSNDFGVVDLNSFSKVVIASDQDQTFYNALDTYKWWFEDYASSGGVLEIHAADWGWNGGQWVGTLPGDLQWVSYSSDAVTIVDHTHPIVTTPNYITDAELDYWHSSVHGYFSTYPADSRIVITEDFTGHPANLEFNYGAGVIVASSQTLEWAYRNSDSPILENILLYAPIKYQHELSVSLDVPSFLEPGDSSLLNATVYNHGLSNEIDVELFLLINGTVVNNITIPEMVNGTSYMIDHSWTPTIEAIYNITAYAPPVHGENITVNNVRSANVTVSYIIAYVAVLNAVEIPSYWVGGWGNDYQTLVDALIDSGFYAQAVTNEEIIAGILDSFEVFVMVDNVPNDAAVEHVYDFWSNGGGIVAFDSSICFLCYAGILPPESAGSNGYYVYWDYNTGSTAKVSTAHPVTDGYPVGQLIPGQTGDAEYLVSALAGTIAYPYYTKLVEDVTISDHAYVSAYEPPTGGRTVHIWDQGHWSNTDLQRMILNAMNWARPFKYEHELAVFLEAPAILQPGNSSLLNATVRNNGLSNEIDVELFLLINGTVVNNITIPEMVNGTSYMIDHSWTPTVEGIYNVTAYAPSVPDENVTANNVMSRMVYVRYVAVALISDYSELLAVTDILDSMGIGYDIYNDNRFYLYTEDLSLLLDYSTVIFYTDYRHITSAEHSTLESYLNLGGNLLITGFDCLVGDYLLADLVRSSSYGDNVGEPDLYVVNATHPIMNGPYGSFPPGYHISGLFSDCDAVEADTARMAVTVAELADGYDRIIATDGLPGKVVFWNGKGDYDWTWNTDCEAMFKNTIVWFTARYEHDLAVSLDTPTSLEPSNSSLLSATVHNLGLNNETDVELFLQINGSIVDNTTIPQLLTSSSYTINYLWSPPIEGTYNITAYAPPVLNESIVENNVLSKMVRVYTVEYPGIMIVPAITMNQTVTPGSNFTVSIYTDYTGADITAYQFNLSYNPAVLNGISVTNGDIIDFGLHFFMPGTFDNVAGTLSLTGAFFFTAGDVAPGPGTLANVTFTVVGTGVSEITLGQKTQLIGWNSTAIPPVEYSIINAATMPDHIGHGYFSNTPQPPQAITATINIKPNTLNLKSERKWITCYIEPPEGYNVSDIDVSTVILNDFLPVSLLDVPAPEPVPTEIGDYDSDGIPDLMVKYNRTELTAHIYHISGITYGNVTLTITGQLADGTPFEGSYNIKVMFGGDADLSGYVEIFDFFIWRENWGKTPDQCPPSVYPDFDDNGLVDMHDFFIWRENFGATVPSPP